MRMLFSKLKVVLRGRQINRCEEAQVVLKHFASEEENYIFHRWKKYIETMCFFVAKPSS